MIERKYKCDLCHEEYHPIRDDNLYGINWVEFPQGGWEVGSTLTCEKHICKKCIISIQKIELR